LAADQRHILEAGIEAAMVRVGNLAEIGGAGAIFAAKAEPLDDARDGQDDRRSDATTSLILDKRSCLALSDNETTL
jgi:hypothetical protein